MSRPIASPTSSSSDNDQSPSLSKVLYLGGTHGTVADVRRRLGNDVEVVEVSSPVKALAQLGRGPSALSFAMLIIFRKLVMLGS